MIEKTMYFILLGLLILMGAAATIYGMVKKRKVYWVSGCISSFVGFVLTALLIYQTAIYLNNQFSFKDVIRESGEAAGKSFGELVTGVYIGIDETLVKIKIYPDSVLIKKGIIFGRAETEKNVTKRIENLKTTRDTNSNSIETQEESQYDNETEVLVKIQMQFTQDYNGQMMLRAYDRNSTEIGKSVLSISKPANTTAKISFYFDRDVEFSLDDYYVLEEL